MTAEQFYANLKKLGLTPRQGAGTGTHMICDTREGQLQSVRRPEDMTGAEREDQITFLFARMGAGMPNFGTNH